MIPMTRSEAIKYIWAIAYAVILFILVRQFVISALSLILLRFSGGGMERFTGNTTTVIVAVSFLCAIIPIYKQARELTVFAGSNIYKLLALVPVCVALTIALNSLITYIGLMDRYEEYAKAGTDRYAAALPIGLICYGLAAPIAEELLFRGVVYGYMKKLMRAGWAVALSAALFGLYHMNMGQGIYAFVMGAVFAGLYERFGDFKVPVLMHIVANVTAYLMTYVSRYSV